MKNALVNYNKNSLLTMERALNSYLDNELGDSMRYYQQIVSTQPKETGDITLYGADYKELLEEVKQVNLLRKQIAYQKRLLKI